jgi:cytochrome c biogenesis protein CcdA
VIDPVADALRAAGSGSALAYPLCFAAGLVSSIGPCVAPRYIAVAALSNGPRPRRNVTAFIAGTIGAYVVLGLGAASLSRLWSSSSVAYAAVALVLAAGGAVTIVRAGGERGPCAHREPADRVQRVGTGSAGLGAPFLLGASGALIVSPCCTPFVAAIAGFTTLSGRAATGASLLAAFAFGHALPLLFAGALGMRLTRLFARLSSSQAPAIVAGSLMLALAAYYGVLA